MMQRTIAAALLGLLAAPVLAGQIDSPAYGQAAGLAAGQSAETVYNGGAARPALQTPVAGAPAAGGPAVETPATTPAARPSLAAAQVPAPEPPKERFFSKRSLSFGLGGAAIGLAGGSAFGVFGAMIGAAAGFVIGFVLSKLLPKLQH